MNRPLPPLRILPYRKPTEGRDYWVFDDVLPNAGDVRERCMAKQDWALGFPHTGESWPGRRALPALEADELSLVEGRVRAALEQALRPPEAGQPAPFQPEARFNLARLELGEGRPERALPLLEKAIEERPNLGAAWYYLASARAALGRPSEAVEAYRRCLGLEPAHTQAALGLAESLLTLGQKAEALRVLRHATQHAGDPAAAARALAKVEGAAKPG